MTSLHSFNAPIDALVVGANGGIGRAFVDILLGDDRVRTVHAWSRSRLDHDDAMLKARVVDVGDGEQLEAAASEIERLSLVVIATGILHSPDGMSPEKSWRSIDPQDMAESFRINTIVPTQILRQVLPLLPRKERAVIGAISARVGSISDNRLGGWHSYRASKAALNQLIKCLSIELRRTHPEAVCLGLHPGTVDTNLSRPFQKTLAANHQLFTPAVSAGHLINVIDASTTDHSGSLLAWNGAVIAP